MPVRPACPACGGQRATQVGGSAAAFETVTGGRALRQPEYHIRQCATCDLYYRVPAIDSRSLPEHYARQPYDVYELGETFPTERAVRRWLDGLADGSRVLDFGCSTGRMLKGMTGRLHCVGVELNASAAAVAAERGIRVVAEEDLGKPELDQFDAIILADVFEHLPAPLEQLARLTNLLAPSGWLAIVTGNADAVRYREFLAEYWYFRTPEHLQMASEKHVAWLAGTLKLRVEALVRCSHYTTRLTTRVWQWGQERAYATFRLRPQGFAAALLRLLPRVRRAEHWAAVPAVVYRDDHLVARLSKGVHA